MQNNQYLLEELRLLQQRRQQQQELLQWSALAAAAAMPKYPSNLLRNLSLGGAASTACNDAAFLRELAQTANEAVSAGQRQQPQQQQPQQLGLLGNFGGAAWTEEAVLRAAAAGSGRLDPRLLTLGFANEAAAARQGEARASTVDANVNRQLQSILEATSEQKRATPKASAVAMRRRASVPTEEREPKRRRVQHTACDNAGRVAAASPPKPRTRVVKPNSEAVNFLVAAAAAAQGNKASSADTRSRSTYSSFPLPYLDEQTQATDHSFLQTPKLASFHSAWGSIKTKKLQKEIFLRKLLGTTRVPRDSSTKIGSALASEKRRDA